jgi:aminoglycoside 3-N-acetyltransferase/aminoglycoside 3-N-acetyltransferase-2
MKQHAATQDDIAADLRRLGVRDGDLIMVHASLRAVGPVIGGPAAIVNALLTAVGTKGTLMAYVSWDRSPYEETLNGARLSATQRAAWPAFEPATAGTYPGFGALNGFLRGVPGAMRSGHPDASMLAIGPLAEDLVRDHRLGAAFGPGSPLERLVLLGGRILLLGAPPDAVTVLHYAEAVAAIRGKRRVTYEMPLRDASGGKHWVRAEDFDSNGILDCYADPGAPDAVECIMRDFLREGAYRAGHVGQAGSHLFDAKDIVSYGVAWLESRHGAR